MLRLTDFWVWDFWIIRDQDTQHAFFLSVSPALHNPDPAPSSGLDWARRVDRLGPLAVPGMTAIHVHRRQPLPRPDDLSPH